MPAFPAPLAAALDAKGFGVLTPVQEAVLDPALAGRDLLVSAQTGSGKTVAFGLAMAEALLAGADTLPPPDTPRALIVAPTRELALQVRREFEWLYAEAGAVVASCVGGMDIRTERRALERGAHIVVGTPGRLRDHLERASLDPALIATVVLDEADEMLDLGFREDLEFILEALPAERRTLMFSATVSPGIERLATTYQKAAERVATADAREAHADIAYRALTVAPEDAENAIVNVLRYHEARNALVFCKTRATVNHLTARLLNRGFAVVPLSGELAQDERARALQAMRDGRARVCVATDVAARGIDLPGLELVIHADLPSNPEVLLHRSGRTGRAGRKGVSALIVPLRARKRTQRLLAEAGVAADWGPAPGAAEVSARDTERLFTDAALTATETAEEHALITALIERFTPRELAAGVVRQYFAARSAPEDIAQATDSAPTPRERVDFARSFWVRLGVGRAARAEPRWLLPMLCRAGDLTRDDIGAIRIFDDETLVQIHADAEARFFNALGDAATLEQEIAVTRAAPPAGAPPRAAPRQTARPDRPRPDRPRPDRPSSDRSGSDRSSSDRPGGAGKPARPDREAGDRTDRAASRPRRDDTHRPPPRAARSDGAAPRQDTRQDTRPARSANPAADRSAPRAEARGPERKGERTGDNRPARSADRPPRTDRSAQGDTRAPRPDRAPQKPREGTGYAQDKPARAQSRDDRSRDDSGRPPRTRDDGPRKPWSGPNAGPKSGPRSAQKRDSRPAAAPAPARPDRASALDPSARLDRPGAKPRGGKPGRAGPAKPRAGKGRPSSRSGPGGGDKPPFRPRRG